MLKCICVMTWMKFILIGQTNTDMLSLSECTSVKPPVACRMESRIRERMHNLVNEIKGNKTMHLVSHAKPIYVRDLQIPVLFIGV